MSDTREAAEGGWDQNAKLVLDKLETLTQHVTKTNDQVVECRMEIATLKVRSSMWGALSGIVTSALGVIYMLFKFGATP